MALLIVVFAWQKCSIVLVHSVVVKVRFFLSSMHLRPGRYHSNLKMYVNCIGYVVISNSNRWMGALIQLLLSSQPNSFSCLAPEFLLPAFFRGDFFFDINRRKCQDDFLNALGKCKFFERQTNCAQVFACGDFFFVSVWQKLSWLKAEEVWGKSWERRYIEWFSPFLFYSISNNHQNQIHVKLHHHINFNFFLCKTKHMQQHWLHCQRYIGL